MFYKMDKLEFVRHFSETWDKDYKQGKGLVGSPLFSSDKQQSKLTLPGHEVRKVPYQFTDKKFLP